MKKLFTALFVTILLFSTLVFTGCNNIKATDENSYNISIYKEMYEQKENGELVYNGLKLKKSFQVVRSQIFELDYETVELVDFNNDVIKATGKYAYKNLPNEYKIANDKKIQALPTKDTTIILREREKKNINVYYGVAELGSRIAGETKVDYNNNFKNTYNEDFYISEKELKSVLGNINSNVVIELYTNPSFIGEPFATAEFIYYYSGVSGALSFKLIKSTNVYIKVVY